MLILAIYCVIIYQYLINGREVLKLMKKLTIIFITLTLMLSVMIMPAHAETQTVYGR